MLDIHMTSDREHYLLIEGKCLLNQSFSRLEKTTTAAELQGACVHACLSIN